MQFALVTIGLMMIISGARDTYAAFGKELVEDFTGPGNFLYWLVALGFLGAIGSIPQFRSFSRAFMALVLISMVIANRGVAAQLSEAISRGPEHPGDNAKTVGSGSTKQLDFMAFADEIAADKDAKTKQNFDRFKQIVGLFT